MRRDDAALAAVFNVSAEALAAAVTFRSPPAMPVRLLFAIPKRALAWEKTQSSGSCAPPPSVALDASETQSEE